MKVITAIGNPYLNEKLKSYKDIEIEGRDIQYQDGIIEMIEEREKIDVLIISNVLDGEHNFKELINKILNIKKDLEIIVFLVEKNDDIEYFLNTKKVYKVYLLNDAGYQKFLQEFIKNTTKNNEQITEEINELKNIILNNKNINIDKNIDKNIKSNENNNDCKFIIIDGTVQSGKTCIGILLSQYISNETKKVLLIEFEKDIKKIMSKSKTEKIELKNIAKSIHRVENNRYLLSEFNLILRKINILNIYEFDKLIDEVKNEFDYIILDFSNNGNNKYIKFLLKKAEVIFFLIEGNLLSIQKSIDILEKYVTDYNIEKGKIKIIINKINKFSLELSELEKDFFDFFVVSSIKYDEKYTSFINNRFKGYIENSSIKEIYELIKDE